MTYVDNRPNTVRNCTLALTLISLPACTGGSFEKQPSPEDSIQGIANEELRAEVSRYYEDLQINDRGLRSQMDGLLANGSLIGTSLEEHQAALDTMRELFSFYHQAVSSVPTINDSAGIPYLNFQIVNPPFDNFLGANFDLFHSMSPIWQFSPVAEMAVAGTDVHTVNLVSLNSVLSANRFTDSDRRTADDVVKQLHGFQSRSWIEHQSQ